MLHVPYRHDQVNLVNKKYLPRFSVVQNNFSLQWRIQGRGPWGPSPPLLYLFDTALSLSQGLDDRTPSPYLKVWIRHWFSFVSFRFV